MCAWPNADGATVCVNVSYTSTTSMSVYVYVDEAARICSCRYWQMWLLSPICCNFSSYSCVSVRLSGLWLGVCVWVRVSSSRNRCRNFYYYQHRCYLCMSVNKHTHTYTNTNTPTVVVTISFGNPWVCVVALLYFWVSNRNYLHKSGSM